VNLTIQMNVFVQTKEKFCENHKNLKCEICKKQATHTCVSGGNYSACQKVLCDDHLNCFYHIEKKRNSKIGIHKMDFTFIQIGRLIVNRNQLSHIFTTEEFQIGAAFTNGYRTIFLKCENEEEVFQKLEKITEMLQLPL